MTLDHIVEMENKARQMARCYCHNFKKVIEDILAKVTHSMYNPNDSNDRQDSSEMLKKIKEFYLTIPFAELNGKDEFYPLFIIRDLLPKFRMVMEQEFESNNDKTYGELECYANAIIVVDGLYRDNLERIIAEIRKNPKHKDFRVAVKDIYNGSTHYL